jgi:hypothetical protein
MSRAKRGRSAAATGSDPAAAVRAPASKNSSTEVSRAAPTIASSASAPACSLSKRARTGNWASGRGRSRSQAAVTIPSVPSEPTIRRFRS